MGNEHSTIANGKGLAGSTHRSAAIANRTADQDKNTKALERARQLEQMRLANVAKKRAEREKGERKAAVDVTARAQKEKEETDRSTGVSPRQRPDVVVRGGPPPVPRPSALANGQEGDARSRDAALPAQPKTSQHSGQREGAPSTPWEPTVKFDCRNRPQPAPAVIPRQEAQAALRAGPPTLARPAPHSLRQEASAPSRDAPPPLGRPPLNAGIKDPTAAWRSGPPPPATVDESSRRSSLDSAIGLPQSDKQQPYNGNDRAIIIPTGPSRRVSSDYHRGMAPPLASVNGAKRPAASYTHGSLQIASDSNAMYKKPRTSSSSSFDSPRSPSGNTSDRLPPAWYSALTVDRRRGKDFATAEVEPLLQSLKNKIRQAKEQLKESTIGAIRHSLHTLPFVKVHEKLLRNNGMLHNETGLPQLFDTRYSGGVDWPFDIKADAEELYNKWSSRTFETDLLRGIIPGSGKSGPNDRSSDKLDDDWPKVSPRYHGNGNLINGQWWPTQLAALRDGAHGSAQGGIYGTTGNGAYSCIMAGSHDYSDKDDGDKDEGDTVYYCGTDSNDGNITAGTKLMMESWRNSRPVRLIRSHKVQSQYAPRMGLRYDGLYDVVNCERLDPSVSRRQRHRFKLVRQPGQDPIRGDDGPAARPTEQEIEAHQKDQRLRGIGGGGGATKGKKGTVFPTWE